MNLSEILLIIILILQLIFVAFIATLVIMITNRLEPLKGVVSTVQNIFGGVKKSRESLSQRVNDNVE